MAITKALPPAKLFLDWKKVERQTGILYVVECAGFHKVGITRDFAKRLSVIDTGTPMPVRKIAMRTVALAGMVYAETWLHHQLSPHHVKGEWFSAERQQILRLLPEAVRQAERHAAQCRRLYAEFVGKITPEDAAKTLAENARLQREYDERMLAHFQSEVSSPSANVHGGYDGK